MNEAQKVVLLTLLCTYQYEDELKSDTRRMYSNEYGQTNEENLECGSP